MILSEYFKSVYEHEVSIRNHYDSRISFTFTLLSAMAISIGFFLADIYSIINCNNLVYRNLLFFLILIVITLFIFQLYLTFKAYFSLNYKYLDFPVNEISEDIKKQILIIGNKYNTTEKLEIYMTDYIEGMLARTYDKCALVYYIRNIKKRKYHHLLNIISFFNLIIILFLYVLNLKLLKGGILS